MRSISDLEYEQLTYDRATGERHHSIQYTRYLTDEEKGRIRDVIREPRIPIRWIKTDYENLSPAKQGLLDTIKAIADERPSARLVSLFFRGERSLALLSAKSHVPDARLAETFGLDRLPAAVRNVQPR
jgi:hypothetical protein